MPDYPEAESMPCLEAYSLFSLNKNNYFKRTVTYDFEADISRVH